jgi:ABC-type antimicrobial peptide transport system permease subunit
VMRMVFATTLGSVGCGIGIGLALSFGLNPFLAQWAKDSSRDPFILLMGTLLLGLASALASAWPAWNASQLDPMTALRSD